MPRPVLTSEQRRATRHLIRKAAADLYAKDGSKRVSVRSIAERAGVSVGTIYANFANLTELMQSLWKEPAKRLFTDLEKITDALDNPKEKLVAILQNYMRFAVEHHAVYRGAFLHVRPAEHAQPEPVQPAEDRFFSLIATAIEAGQQEGLFRKGDTSMLTQLVWSAIHGAIALPINIDRLALDTSEKVVQEMLDLMLEWLESTA